MQSLNETADLSKFMAGLRGDRAMFSYTFINSHSQVSNPVPRGPSCYYRKSFFQ